ncbi:MAG: pyridoxine 5'-phosphate synthase [Nitrospinae bacterium CG11_big_fil_rev_8_21_14_0_20_56_8]|nr:MAG: pyridoxine 5'-phosphate synthase [Nitrospinae bacterium CG11_big_fil_rev_8_21_14_0_20_56_8]
MIRLFVNVDHVATIREARKTTEPDPLAAALLAEAAGAHGITVHLREDRRHIQDHDVRRIISGINTPLNLEMAAVEEMVRLALEIRPYQVSLVPERRQEITTEGGLDVCSQEAHLKAICLRVREKGIRYSLFIDPDPRQVDAAVRVEAESMEINTGLYSEQKEPAAIARELDRIRCAARAGAERGLRVFAGHGLTCDNVVAIAAIPEIEELNIGHHVISRSVFVGLDRSVREMMESIDKGVRKRPAGISKN